jgi:hypothetical protein
MLRPRSSARSNSFTAFDWSRLAPSAEVAADRKYAGAVVPLRLVQTQYSWRRLPLKNLLRRMAVIGCTSDHRNLRNPVTR